MKRELDTADRKIVELLQEDARLPLKSIADKVSLTSPTVSARIDRLEKDGVITGYRATLSDASGEILRHLSRDLERRQRAVAPAPRAVSSASGAAMASAPLVPAE